MAKIIPFKAVRPTRDKVSLLACRSYETYTKAEREARMEVNPFSFLHILDPGFKYHQEISGERRYTLVKNRFQEFKEDGIFLQDEKPSLYFYKIVNREGLEFNGVIAGTSTLDYKNNIIKKYQINYPIIEGYDSKDFLKFLVNTYGWTGYLPYTLIVKNGITKFIYPEETSYSKLERDILSI